jgi:hypothetical protein
MYYTRRFVFGTGVERDRAGQEFHKEATFGYQGLYRFLFNVHLQYLWQLEYYSIIGLKYKPV